MKLKIFILKDGYQLKIYKNNEWYILAESNSLSYAYKVAKKIQRFCNIPFINLVRL